MTRVQPVVLDVLRAALADVSVVSVVPAVDYRRFPLVAVRRAGGVRNRNLPHLHSRPVVDIAAVSAVGPVEADELYEDVLDALYSAVGEYFQSVLETRGATSTASPYPDTWAVEGSVQLALRTA